MRKSITLLAVTTSVIAILSGCSSGQFDRTDVTSSSVDASSGINLGFDIEAPQSSAIRDEEIEIPSADNKQKETSSETRSSKEESSDAPGIYDDNQGSETASVPETNAGGAFDSQPDDNNVETSKPDSESKPEDAVSTRPQAAPETKPHVAPEIKPTPETESVGISESDIAGFYPDNFNCKELTIGETHKPSAAIWLNNGKGKVYSSDESVAVVNGSGVVTAKGKGTAYIKIVASTGMSKVYRYTINECGITEDDILGFYPDDFNTFELAVGETHKPLASKWLADGNGKVYSYDESVVTVNASGVVTATGEGVAYIKIIGSTGMSEMYMYVVDSTGIPHNSSPAL